MLAAIQGLTAQFFSGGFKVLKWNKNATGTLLMGEFLFNKLKINRTLESFKYMSVSVPLLNYNIWRRRKTELRKAGTSFLPDNNCSASVGSWEVCW